jgi:GAF domain-containing protein
LDGSVQLIMKSPPRLPQETERLAAVRELALLDTPPEERFDRIARIAMRLFDVPIAFVALVDATREWFKSRYGLSVSEISREVSFSGYTILENQALVIPDATKDERFCDNPLVTGPPHIRFYAGQILRAANGYPVGTLGLADEKPRDLDQGELKLLQDLGAMAERELNYEEALQLRKQLLAARESAEKRLRLEAGAVAGVEPEDLSRFEGEGGRGSS